MVEVGVEAEEDCCDEDKVALALELELFSGWLRLKSFPHFLMLVFFSGGWVRLCF